MGQNNTAKPHQQQDGVSRLLKVAYYGLFVASLFLFLTPFSAFGLFDIFSTFFDKSESFFGDERFSIYLYLSGLFFTGFFLTACFCLLVLILFIPVYSYRFRSNLGKLAGAVLSGVIGIFWSIAILFPLYDVPAYKSSFEAIFIQIAASALLLTGLRTRKVVRPWRLHALRFAGLAVGLILLAVYAQPRGFEQQAKKYMSPLHLGPFTGVQMARETFTPSFESVSGWNLAEQNRRKKLEAIELLLPTGKESPMYDDILFSLYQGYGFIFDHEALRKQVTYGNQFVDLLPVPHLEQWTRLSFAFQMSFGGEEMDDKLIVLGVQHGLALHTYAVGLHEYKNASNAYIKLWLLCSQYQYMEKYERCPVALQSAYRWLRLTGEITEMRSFLKEYKRFTPKDWRKKKLAELDTYSDHDSIPYALYLRARGLEVASTHEFEKRSEAEALLIDLLKSYPHSRIAPRAQKMLMESVRNSLVPKRQEAF